MKHAIRRLREERLQLLADLQTLQTDPSVGGGLDAANATACELRVEIREVEAAIELLDFADDGARTRPARRGSAHV